MMMTCRLLCALLVLALCCCPYVCVADTEPVEPLQSPQKSTLNTTQEPGSKPNDGVGAQGLATSLPSLHSGAPGLSSATSGRSAPSSLFPHLPGGLQATSKPDSPGPESEPIAEPLQETADSGLPVTLPESVSEPGTLHTEGNNGTRAQQSHTSPSAVQSEQNAEHPADTTNTKKTPTTTTTTTAPEAPSTTSTESPTVSTTHTPSRLREIDGSLSSSAWVCAPLVLAASALACTALG
ncbi:mucin TcMUCII, putative [Trypanosoma cruzi marinkellei]|uniref:Mucin TcMUCII, putative n=1 Tax=Trypanosoma cruzi marinkellei TaxID=85056 RepID=K2NIM0_TRYCR|nr:mucin TcMUCII, putative [Trypanosoma cruzi marinkellei]